MNLYAPTVKRKLFAALFLWSLVVFMPGAYSVDSFNYFYQFNNNAYSDWHPPLIAFVWKVLYQITGYYEMLYAVQIALYWYMGYILAGRIITSKIAFWVCIGLLILFQFIPQYIMKDSQSVICWGMASLLMIEACNNDNTPGKRKWVNIGVFLLLAYGFWARINAFMALIPLLLVYVERVVPQVQKWWKKGLVIIGIVAGLFIANNIITYRILKASKAYPEYKLMLLDIVGISKQTDENYLPAELTSYEYFNRERLMQAYTPASFDEIYWPKDGQPAMVPPPTEQIVKSVSGEWKRAIMHHPIAYFNNRMQGFLYYLRIRHRFERNEYWNMMLGVEAENPIEVRKPDSSYSYKFAMGSFTDTLFFEPWFWLLLNMILCLYFMLKYRRQRYREYKAMALVQLSGVLYTLSQFPIYQHDQDFRYNYWNLIVFLIGFVYMIGKPMLTRNPDKV